MRNPSSPLAKLIRVRLNDHLAPRNLDGETAYVATARTFERPYGQAWAMRLTTELDGWNDPDAAKWSAALTPMVTRFAAAMPAYGNDMPDAVRQGTTANTANVLHLLVAYADGAHDAPLRAAIDANARRLFQNDADCPTAYEADPAAVLSPCLAEAALMGSVLDRQAFAAWLTRFLPPLYGPAFHPLTLPLTVAAWKKIATPAAKANAIGLAFARARADLDIAAALPPQDPRVPFFRRLAALQAAGAYQSLALNGANGTQWIAAFAMLYQAAVPPSPPPAVKSATATP